jgi:hypothetical protein
MLLRQVVGFVVAAAAVYTSDSKPVIAATAKVCNVADASGECRAHLMAGILLVVFAIQGVVELWDTTHPLRRLSEIQKRYVELHLKPLLMQFQKRLGSRALRLNIMVPGLGLRGRELKFLFPIGFKDGHSDQGIRLTRWQGVAGAAMRSRNPVYWYFDDEWNRARPKLKQPMLHPPTWFFGLPAFWGARTPWGLTPKQMENTTHVRWIMSVQMFRPRDDPQDARPSEVRGVINFDTTDPKVARMLAERDDLRATLFVELAKLGKLCAELW